MKSRSANQRPVFQARFWGVRGSYPTPEERTLKFGGHTSCVEVKAGQHRLIFDAGTGIIPLGKKLMKTQRSDPCFYIFLSHTHHDHIFGLYFFEPLDQRSARLFVFGPDATGISLRTTLERATQRQFFPIRFKDFGAYKQIRSLKGGEMIRLKARRQTPATGKRGSLKAGADDDVTILTQKSPAHPKDGVLLYRISYRGRSLVYATDIEQKKGGYADAIQFFRGTDLLIHDAQYLSREYFSRKNSRKGWGHSTVESAVEAAQKGQVKRLVLFHHEPTHDDRTIREMERRAQRLFPAAAAAYEGMEVDLL